MTRRHEVLTHVLDAIATADGCARDEIEYSLYDHVEPEALLTLVTSEHTDWRLSFSVPDHRVKVCGDGRIVVDNTVVRERNAQSSKVR